MSTPSYDVVIIGGSAAGLTTALTLGRSRRSVLVIDAGEPRNAPAAGVHNVLTRDGAPPAALLDLGRAEVASYGVVLVAGRVTDVGGARGEFVVTWDGGTATAARIVVATGVEDLLPDLPGIREGWGRTVLHCPYCHGWEVRDEAVGVLALSPLAGHQAMLFSQLTADLVLFRNGQEIDTALVEALGVRVVDGTVLGFEDGVVRLSDGTAVARDALALGAQTRARVPAGLGLELTELAMSGTTIGWYVASDPMTRQTAVPGVYVAGNAGDLRGSVASAIADGTVVAGQVNADLVLAKAERLRSERQT
jgi:thioredoxin reductase